MEKQKVRYIFPSEKAVKIFAKILETNCEEKDQDQVELDTDKEVVAPEKYWGNVDYENPCWYLAVIEGKFPIYLPY